jgi:SPP1 gp7 family putative phage head morphogenesis protein
VNLLAEVSISSTIISKFLKAIYDQQVTDGQPDPDLFNRTWKKLFRSFEAGYGKSLGKIKYNSPDYAFLEEIKYNTAVFSAFKQNAQIKDAAKLLVKDDGSARTWKEFLDAAMEVDDTYNKRWLQTEFNQAHSSALQARRYKDAVKTASLYPNLEYISVRDGRTRESHKKLHGTVRPIGDLFWGQFMPPIDWGCRCTIRPTDKPVTAVPAEVPEVPEGMDVNTAVEGKIFSDNHPYIKGSADKKDELIKFVNNQLL